MDTSFPHYFFIVIVHKYSVNDFTTHINRQRLIGENNEHLEALGQDYS